MGDRCSDCGKELRAAREGDRCLTCAYRARSAARYEDTLVEPASATATLAALEPQAATTSPAARTARLFTGPTNLPYTPAQVLGSIHDYDLLEEIGHGGMGVVYKAFSRRLGRYVALKVIRSGERATDIEVARFLNEAMLAARLSHPHIVRIYDAGRTDEGLCYFVMELVLGRNLGAFLSEGTLPQRAIVEIVEKTARAVHYAHTQGVVHRDIKPDNVLVDDAQEPHITDFGIAKGTQDAEAGLTTAGSIMGSPHYMSPEQANGETGAIGPRTDVYSLGATLFHVLTGRTPFEGPTPMSILVQVLSAEPPRPAALARQARRPPVPIDLETICLKAMEKEAARRYDSAAELADELSRWREGEPILARPVGALERFGKRLRKNRRLLAIAAAALLLVVTLGAAFSVSLFDNVNRSSASLEELDRTQAVAQATTLDRAIRVNMLQGRADLARSLVGQLSTDADVGSIEVARVDKVPAYTDLKTRRQVEQRLAKPEVMEWIRQEHPELVADIEELRRRAFPNIDQSRPELRRAVQVSETEWRRATERQEIVTYVEADARGARRLVILKPMENSPKCQACHGRAEDSEYAGNKVRAVLVVKRPLERLDQMIDNNRETTLLIGSVTLGVLLLLGAVLMRIFGIGFGREKFGATT